MKVATDYIRWHVDKDNFAFGTNTQNTSLPETQYRLARENQHSDLPHLTATLHK